jgi:hypothetical protein
MSLYALTASGLQRIKRAWYGTPIPTELKQDANGNMVPVEGGATTDPGVQTLVNELLAGLSTEGPIPLAGSLQMVQPDNGPAIQLYVTNTAQPIIQFVNQNDNTLTNINSDGSISTLTNNNFVNLNQNFQQQQQLQQVVTNVTNSNGFTGQITVMTGATISVSGCSVTVNATTATITFNNGTVTGLQ